MHNSGLPSTTDDYKRKSDRGISIEVYRWRLKIMLVLWGRVLRFLAHPLFEPITPDLCGILFWDLLRTSPQPKRYNTGGSTVVPDQSTNPAQCWLTSVCLSLTYGCSQHDIIVAYRISFTKQYYTILDTIPHGNGSMAPPCTHHISHLLSPISYLLSPIS